jgi:hypothetical protein
MYYFEDNKPQPRSDSSEPHRLLLDGTVNLDYTEDENPQSNGWIALLKQYLASRTA